MNKHVYSNEEFTELKKRINTEILRRSTFKYNDPLAKPRIGTDRSSPLSLPNIGEQVPVDDLTYTINNSSEGSIERTRNIEYPSHGENPGGANGKFIDDVPRTSAAHFTVDEIKNFLVGLAKIRDINLFYGRDEKAGIAFRDTDGIEEVLVSAEKDELNTLAKIKYHFHLDENGNLILSYYTENLPELIIDGDNIFLISSDNEEEAEILTYRFQVDKDGFLLMENRAVLEDFASLQFRVNEDNYLVIDDLRGTEHVLPFKFYIEDGYLIMDDNNANPGDVNIYINEHGDLIFETERDEMMIKFDPNGGVADHLNPNYPEYKAIQYDEENGTLVMPSGESDGEEIQTYEGLGVNNFFDDYGARPGDGNYHPFNRAKTPQTRRDWYEYDKSRNHRKIIVVQGGINTATYGENPRNPNPGKPYRSIPVYKGVPGTCHIMCTGLCYFTCDSQCSESCTVTCFSRCGNSCTATCGNVCTGCSSMCQNSCKTKCENTDGYACLKAGAKTVKIETLGGKNGMRARNTLSYTTFSCTGCQFSCQFYPNKKTECWDAGCMGKCFTSCMTVCSTSCLGGCIDNNSENSNKYKNGKGRGCSAGCTVNCVGTCQGVCEGSCISTCAYACKELCHDNCVWVCSTNCGNGCDNGCKNGCTGCTGTCEAYCTGQADRIGCTGCGMKGGCTSSCQFDCNRNCVGKGCRSICGTDAAGACEANCRINCMNSSCTAMCSDACSNLCTTCVNTCGWQCGACSSECSTGCGAACEITCTATCEHSCDLNCVRSCTESCGACSSLCYSCVAMCIGVCSFKCESTCSSCANNCGWWCDSYCNQQCFSNCSLSCMISCEGSCITFLTSDTKLTNGPERPPTSEGYYTPNPSNREEEQESFRIIKEDNND